jgi:hypothetical protein
MGSFFICGGPATFARPGIFVNRQFQQIFVQMFVQVDEKLFPKKVLTN